MFKEAGKMYDNMAGLSVTFVEKIKHHMKAVETYVKDGDAAENRGINEKGNG